MTHCPICSGSRHVELDRRARIPLLQNRVWDDPVSARAAPAGSLRMFFCTDCEFAWNDAFDPSVDLYDPAYDNNQLASNRFHSHVEAMVDRIVAAAPAEGGIHLVEIGCGQGTFLATLADAGLGRFESLTGFDPAWRGQTPTASREIQIRQSYFGDGRAPPDGAQPDFIVSRHTIEHVADPLRFLRSIRAHISDSPRARLFLETPDIGWILRNLQLQDLFYEHCSIFSPRTFEVALALAGFEILHLEQVFGGQYLWVEARPSEAAAFSPPRPCASDEALRFVERRPSFTNVWRKRIEGEATRAPVWLWGASSKGVTFALLVDGCGARLSGAIDINPDKIGRYMPISGLPIATPEELPNGAVVILMNPNYRSEVVDRLEALEKTVELLSLAET
jgi:SAM-dependent methyltransferase